MIRSAITVLFLAIAASAFAQSPNTAAVVVTVVDQTGGVVPGASVSAVNAATGDARQAVSGADGSATLTALQLTGSYRVSVEKAGFTTESVSDLALRGGETASVRVKLVAAGGTSEVTVYGTTQGVRNDPRLGVRLDSGRIEDTPLLGRKISALPLLNAAFRNAKGTGDLFMNSVYFVTGAGGRRQADFIVDGATGNELWGRQTMITTLPVVLGAGDGRDVERLFERVRLDVEHGRQRHHQVGHQHDRTARRCSSDGPGGMQTDAAGIRRAVSAVGVELRAAEDERRDHADRAAGHSRRAGAGIVRARRRVRAGQDALFRRGRLHPPGSDGGRHLAAGRRRARPTWATTVRRSSTRGSISR